jgi:hypothetical protein
MTTTEAKPKQEFLFNNEEGIWRNSAKTSQTRPLLIVEGHVYRQCKKNTAECVARFRDNAHVVEVLTAAGCKFLERVLPVQTLKRLFFYQAKVGTMPGSIVAVKHFPKIVTSQTPDNPTLAFGNFFAVNQRLEIADLEHVKQVPRNCIRWQTGIIWKIEDDRLFINLQ